VAMFTLVVSCACVTGSKGMITLNDRLGTMLKEAAVVYFKVLFQQFL